MTESLVTIIIPCFNAEQTIEESVRSALNQSYARREVIVVDDGSTDGSKDILRRFGPDIICIEGSHCGGNAARNRGIAESKGEWIQFLDADDVLYPDKLARQVPTACANANAMVFCHGVLVCAGKANRKEFAREMKKGSDPIVYLLSNRVQTSAFLHRRDRLLEIGGFREDLPCAQEFDLHLRLAVRGYPLFQLPEYLFEVRTRRGSVSDNYERVMDQYDTVLQPVYAELMASGYMTDERRAEFARKFAHAGRVYMRIGCREKGKRYFDIARTLDRKNWLTVYGQPARLLRHVLGPYLLEKLAMRRRAVTDKIEQEFEIDD